MQVKVKVSVDSDSVRLRSRARVLGQEVSSEVSPTALPWGFECCLPFRSRLARFKGCNGAGHWWPGGREVPVHSARFCLLRSIIEEGLVPSIQIDLPFLFN